MFEKEYRIIKATDLRGYDKSVDRVGRKGNIHQYYSNVKEISIGLPLLFEYTDKELIGKCMRTSKVESVEYELGKIVVTTKNTVYVFGEVE